MQALRFLVKSASAAILLAYVIAATANATTLSNDDAEIAALITDLDAGKFAEREAATNELINIGGASLKPVALKYLDANPETAWRIKRILKSIATEAEQELTSLKAIGVLIVVEREWDSELSGLLSKWRENRSRRAIKFLVQKGATTTPTGAHRQLFFSDLNNQRLVIGASASNPEPSNPLRKQFRSTKNDRRSTL